MPLNIQHISLPPDLLPRVNFKNPVAMIIDEATIKKLLKVLIPKEKVFEESFLLLVGNLSVKLTTAHRCMHNRIHYSSP